MPVIDGKRSFVYCTYAKDPANTLTHLANIVKRRGGEVEGGYAIHRKNLDGGALEFVTRLLSAIETAETGAEGAVEAVQA